MGNSSLSIIHSRTQVGTEAIAVDVEVHLANGLPCFNVVGMPEMAVRESKDRVRGAILNSRFDFPAKRITVNLSPADVPKAGGRFDLPIAIGILVASQQLSADAIANYEVIGELALGGVVKGVSGCLPTAVACKNANRQLLTGLESASEASLVSDLTVIAAKTLCSAVAHLSAVTVLPPYIAQQSRVDEKSTRCLSQVKGQKHAKRAMEVAAAGGHHMLFFGAPGTGKTMLASRLNSILPELTVDAALESAAIASISSQTFEPEKWRIRPFRQPHHGASAVALIGGGTHPKPGEISLAHNGTLFLDEIPEFSRHALEQLREPLELGYVNIARANLSVTFNCQFQLIASMNVCPCGWYGDSSDKCQCSQTQIDRYRNKLSGPMLDRIDMHIALPRVSLKTLSQKAEPDVETSATVRQRVTNAHKLQMKRQGCLNFQLESEQLLSEANLKPDAQQLIETAGERLHLTMRSYFKVLKVARTIADLNGQEKISVDAISEALSYRALI